LLPKRERDEERGDKPGDKLGHPVGHDVLRVALAPDEHGERDRGIKVSAGNVSAGENHDHQGRADGQWSEVRVTAHGHADGEDEKERADEFNEVFFHEVCGDRGKDLAA